ncbi:hypothetical protein LSTR_LSTR007722 [Laodelphax striatellus]|uniref:Essential MCU regulator, mitochondrial n=1 Tax=Laodelphax striatellus TaxID=195883 RepID=A0A482X9U5_LAOST|nr:hypothetical protein LSTR_LSTR007722 [Laodelphax striatellus]
MIGRVLTRGLTARNAIQKSQLRTIVSLPPQKRASFTTKLLLGGAMCGSSLIIPAYVIANLKHYNGSINAPPEEELEDEE